MHDDDLPEEDLRAALERRARRSRPAGVDELLARADVGAGRAHRGRGAWLTAAAVLVLLGGLVGYVASVQESRGGDPTEVPAASGQSDERGADDGPESASQGRPAGWPTTLTVADLRDQLGVVDLLVVNGTWGLAAEEVPAELSQALEAYGDGAALIGRSRVEPAGDAPLTTSFVVWQPPVTRELAALLGAQIGIDRVVQGRLTSDQYGVERSLENLVVVIGADVDPRGATCADAFDPERCVPAVKWREEPWSERGIEQPSILHPPAEVRVLTLNGTAVVGAAGRLSDNLRTNFGYDALTPGNAISPAVETAVYYVPAYELDARQLAHQLSTAQGSVQPLPDGVVPEETEGDPHVVVVLGDDYVG